jgi:hypothetical protein
MPMKLSRALDLPTAIKATEDALAFVMGASDGDPRWRSESAQEPGGAFGVRIEMQVAVAARKVGSDAPLP